MRAVLNARTSRSFGNQKDGKPKLKTITRLRRKVDYVVIHEGRIVCQGALSKCFGFQRHHGIEKISRVASIFSNEAKKRPRIERNPLAELLSGFVEHDCLTTLEEETGFSVSDESSHGITYLENPIEETRTSTNAECGIAAISVGYLDQKFDRCRKLPPQIAKWCRNMADKFHAAADRIEAIEDIRNLKVVRRLIAEEGYLETLHSQGLTLDDDGRIVRTE